MKGQFICYTGRWITAAFDIDFLPWLILGWDMDVENGNNGGCLYQILDISPDCLQPLTFILSDFSD